MSVVGDLVVKLRGDASGLVHEIKSTSSLLHGLGGFLESTMGVEVLEKGYETLKDTIKETVGASMQYQVALRNINTMAKLSDHDLHEMGNQLEEVAVRFGLGSKDITTAMYDIYSSGFTGKGAMDVVETGALAARAGLASVSEATSAVITGLNAYGLSGEYAGDVSDVLFKTVEKGRITFGQLASGLGNVVSTASAAGVSLPQVGAALATLTNKGILPDEAVTSLNMALSRLLEGTETLNPLFKEFGNTSNALKQIGLGGMMKKIVDVTGGDAKKIQNLGFQIRDFKAIAALASDDGKLFADNLKAIDSAAGRAGATQGAFNEQTKSNYFIIEQIGSALHAAGVKFGEIIDGSTGFRMVLTDIYYFVSQIGEELGGYKSTLQDSPLNQLPEQLGYAVGLAKTLYDVFAAVGNAISMTFFTVASTVLKILQYSGGGLLMKAAYKMGVIDYDVAGAMGTMSNWASDQANTDASQLMKQGSDAFSGKDFADSEKAINKMRARGDLLSGKAELGQWVQNAKGENSYLIKAKYQEMFSSEELKELEHKGQENFEKRENAKKIGDEEEKLKKKGIMTGAKDNHHGAEAADMGSADAYKALMTASMIDPLQQSISNNTKLTADSTKATADLLRTMVGKNAPMSDMTPSTGKQEFVVTP